MQRLAVVGDHRRPIWIDRIRGSGERGRRAIFEEIGRLRPGLLLDTGDLVPSASAAAWRAFDRDIAALRAAGTGIEAVPGNHETYGVIPVSARAAVRMAPFLARFPRTAGRRFGVRDFGSTRILLLDSNARVLATEERRAQERFLEEAAAAADADPAVELLLAAWHHPPFTNGAKYGDDRFSASSFLPRLRASRKLGAVFCGHVHGYERFWSEGISLVVTGGGGARAHRFPRDAARQRHTPAFDASSLPPLHFVDVSIDGGVARAVVRHLQLPRGGAARWIEGDRFEIRARRGG